MQDGCKVYMDFYMASNGSCFMVPWTIFKNHLLEVGLTQNQETMALRTLTTVDNMSIILCKQTAPNMVYIVQRCYLARFYIKNIGNNNVVAQYLPISKKHNTGGLCYRLQYFYWIEILCNTFVSIGPTTFPL